jgi:choline dehydrogenase-like flavoprotein
VSFDYIIVGAGSAGCVLAESLSASGVHGVLLIEAGPPDDSLLIHMPKGMGRIMGQPRYNHIYQVEPDDYNARRNEVWLRGMTLGGSSAINGMVYNRGQPVDYDHLETLGCSGWNWANMLPHFQAIEDHPLGASEWRGAGGPLRLSLPAAPSPLAQAIIASAQSVGLTHLEDINSAHGAGAVGLMPHTIRDGRRMTSAATFLKRAAGRRNLEVVTGKLIDRLLLDGREAVGVLCADGTEYRSNRETILAAGALESPGILMRSGIGPAEKLRALGIPVVYDAPEIGQNLIEHFSMATRFGVRSYRYSDNNAYKGWRLATHVARYLATRSGLMGQGSFEVGMFLRATPESARPDARLLTAPFAFDNTKQPLATWDSPSFSIFGTVLSPDSRGTLELRSRDPRDKPIIRPNYLATERDRRISLGTLGFIRRLAASAPLSEIISAEEYPGPAVQSDEAILEAWCKTGSTGFHTIGTCAMGSHPTSVLDPRLRVRGIDRVRVMDAGVLPHMVSANTNAPVLAMAHRAAELILTDARLNSQAA